MNQNNSVILLTVIAIVVGFCAFKPLIETFIPSPYPRVIVADGHCRGRHPAMSDFVYKNYPFYQAQSSWKPLSKAMNYPPNQINFDNQVPTTLY